ncbi:MAG: peptidase T [Porphyromonas sp.]|nr:peptidase T [Porphyromonas sp.]
MSIQTAVKDQVLECFLRYARIDTESDYKSTTYPSTSKQLDLLKILRDELVALGASEVEMDQYGYVMATIPASPGCENAPIIGLIAHVDTSPDLSGKDVKPQIINNYQGGEIPLGSSGYTLSPNDFPELSQFVGHDLVTTDGTTLLGADDKAGVAEIMTIASYLLSHPEVAHGKVRIGFTADEEIGRGVDHFDVARFGADFAYTLDGSMEGELEYECFNACSAELVAQGRNIHPGYAKGKMINALQALCDVHNMLPENERPENTEGFNGFYHLIELGGSVDRATARYIIRDHSREIFENRKQLLAGAVRTINAQLGSEVITLQLTDQYYNMKEMIEPHMELINIAAQAMLRTGVRPIIRPIRGGTDGARLSFMGLPCPNLFAGGMNFHGRFEYVSVQTMSRAVETVVHILSAFSELNRTNN